MLRLLPFIDRLHLPSWPGAASCSTEPTELSGLVAAGPLGPTATLVQTPPASRGVGRGERNGRGAADKVANLSPTFFSCVAIVTVGTDLRPLTQPVLPPAPALFCLVGGIIPDGRVT